VKSERSILILISLAVLGGGALILISPKTERPLPQNPIPADTNRLLILEAASKATTTPTTGISGITVPHHLLAADLIARAFKSIASPTYDRIIILSPDHYWLGEKPISVATNDFVTPFGIVKTDEKFTNILLTLPNTGTNRSFYREHGIVNIVSFVGLYFPHVPVVAIELKENLKKPDADLLTDALKELASPNTLVIQSTDFSHYLTPLMAWAEDFKTLEALRSTNTEKAFTLSQPNQIDSAAAQYIQLRLQREFFHSYIQIQDHKNSQDYTKEPVSSSTSYIVEIFRSR
jgi:poly-gamma-glutamate synthesis protein (capsule biosynthesis protein)